MYDHHDIEILLKRYHELEREWKSKPRKFFFRVDNSGYRIEIWSGGNQIGYAVAEFLVEYLQEHQREVMEEILKRMRVGIQEKFCSIKQQIPWKDKS